MKHRFYVQCTWTQISPLIDNLTKGSDWELQDSYKIFVLQNLHIEQTAWIYASQT